MPSSKPKLLIVDDEPSIRTTLSLIFTELGYSVRSASDGFAALALIQELAPDILLSDLSMPGMSGFELLSVVRRVHPTIHVVATSGAYFGKSVPQGVAADAFYEKASGLGFLFEVIKLGAQSGRPIRGSSDEPTPMWISPTGKLASDEFYVLMGCPSCLRAFPKVLVEKQQLVCETDCLHCGAAISYAIVPIVDPGAEVSSDRRHPPGAIDMSGMTVRFDVPVADLAIPIRAQRLAG
jgi:CheY-like chemotaxis protein